VRQQQQHDQQQDQQIQQLSNTLHVWAAVCRAQQVLAASPTYPCM
jgi:hypothetical protein